MVRIDKSVVIKDDLFKVSLKDITPAKRRTLMRKSLKYSFLKNNEEFLIMEVLAHNAKSEIILSPKEVVPVIDTSIESLIDEEYYEQCIVLKEVKDTFNTYFSNDN